MALSPLDIAVVGTGTAGSACALFLARQGHRVTVYERIAQPEPVGAGIMLQPTGMTVLRALGLESQVVPLGERIDQLVVETSRGRPVMTLPYGVLKEGLYGVGLHRGALFAALVGAVQREHGVQLELGVDVLDLHTHRDGRLGIVESNGRRSGKHDLVVVANGARSSLRDDTALAKSATPYPWGALWAMVPDEAHRYRGRLFQVVRGTRQLIGLLPTGRKSGGGPPLVSFFFSLRGDRLAEFRAGDFEAWKAGVLEDLPSAGPVLSALTSADSLLYAQYHDVVMWPWNTERVVYVGDAAHATSPQLGQGCNLALLDAWFLSQAMSEAESVPDALYSYSRRRRWHLTWYQLMTRWLTPFFQSDFGALGVLRDAAFPIVTRSTWVQRQMVAAMAGVSRGPFLDVLPMLDGH